MWDTEAASHKPLDAATKLPNYPQAIKKAPLKARLSDFMPKGLD